MPRAAEPADAAHRQQLAQRFGAGVAARVPMRAEVYLFVLEHRGLAVAYSRSPGDGSAASWAHQARLQRVLNVGVDPPLIVVGAQIAGYAEGVDRLVVDPDVDELTALCNPTPGAPDDPNP